MTEKLLIIGCGNMGGAMLAGWLGAGVPASRFAVLDPALEKAPEGVALYRDAAAAAKAGHDTVMLGFKPQQLGALSSGLQDVCGAGITICSLLAGLTLAQLGAAFPQSGAQVRVMPNLAAAINKSPIILCQQGLESVRADHLFALYDQLGTAMWLEDESAFDLVTALAGSGPGFVYRFIDALAGGAEQLGLDRAIADRLALAMVEGAASLAAGADASPAVLADRVASPGGMTREGMNVLDNADALLKLMTETLRAARDKGIDLSRQS
ncbi:MAG: pyrroline-5-carboxylate reductase family protein [Erythrobacter sp.]